MRGCGTGFLNNRPLRATSEGKKLLCCLCVERGLDGPRVHLSKSVCFMSYMCKYR